MSINFPTSLDTLTNPTGTDNLDSPDHATQHADENDAVEALEAKVGVDGSAVATSHDYKLSGVSGSDKAVSKTGTETLTNKTLTSPLFTGTIDGWISAGTWAYASATTITVPSGAALIYQKGDKLKLTQTTVKYLYVADVADTVLTVTGGSDYSVANAAITSPYYSHADNPLGFPDLFNWTPTLTGGASDLSGYTEAKFTIKGNTLFFIFQATSKNVTGSAGTIQITLPLNVTSASSQIASYINDGSTWVMAHLALVNGSNIMTLYKTLTAGGWVATETGVYINIRDFYEI